MVIGGVLLLCERRESLGTRLTLTYSLDPLLFLLRTFSTTHLLTSTIPCPPLTSPYSPSREGGREGGREGRGESGDKRAMLWL